MENNAGAKTFTQEEVNRIVSERLAQERKKIDGIDPAQLAADRAELEAYRAEKEANTWNDRINAVLNGREFVNDFTRKGIIEEFKTAAALPDNLTKGDNVLFDELTKDRDGIFQSRHKPVNMGGFGKNHFTADPEAEALRKAFAPPTTNC